VSARLSRRRDLPYAVCVSRPDPHNQAREFVARYGTRAGKTARERRAAAVKRDADRETERHWVAVEREIEALQRAGEAPVPVWGAKPKGDEHRTERLDLRVTPSWHQLVTDAAKAADVSVTDWVIEACERHARRRSQRKA
jgi:uncharacterized protein DUF1778